MLEEAWTEGDERKQVGVGGPVTQALGVTTWPLSGTTCPPGTCQESKMRKRLASLGLLHGAEFGNERLEH